jgi:hypothetical protein
MTVVIPDVPTAFAAEKLPSGATAQYISSGNKAAATASAAIPATAGQFSYLNGFEVVGAGATAASIVLVTVTDGTWTLTYPLAVVAGVTLQNGSLIVRFPSPLRSTAVNTAITVSCPSLGSGSTNNCVNAEGYVL